MLSTNTIHAEHIERRIGEARMAASLDSDWDELHVRSRQIRQELARESEPSGQIAAARRIRTDLCRSNDTPGLRALRLATAGVMADWLRQETTVDEAQALAQLYMADQRRGIPGISNLEKQLERIRASERAGRHSNLAGQA